MGIKNRSHEVEIRDTRLSSILTYYGNAADLHQKSLTAGIKCTECSFSQTGECSQATGQHEIMHIRDVAVISHAPIGCGGVMFVRNVENYVKQEGSDFKADDIKAVSCNLQEKDTIYGGSEKLYGAIIHTYHRFKPRAIIISTSCAAAIVGDDVEGVISEAGEALGIPIAAVYCEGFRSKIWATGFDTTYHAMIRSFIKPAEKKEPDLINIFTFHGEKKYIDSLISKIGIRARYFMFHSDLNQISEMASAAASTQICRTLSTYITKVLEDEFGVPEIKSPVPFGIAWTDQWVRAIGRTTGREELAEQVIKTEHERIALDLEHLREQLKGKTVYVLAGDTFAHHLIAIAKDLGMEVTGTATFHHDLRFDDEDKRMDGLNNLIKHHGNIENYAVCNKQPYQLIKLLDTIRPDLMIARHPGISVTGVKMGIPTFYAGDPNTELGYDGVIEVGRRIVQSLAAKNFVKNLAPHVKWPYTQWWKEQKDPFYFEHK